MTVQTSTTVATGIGNGVTTVFPVGFKFNQAEDLIVNIVDDAEQTETLLTLDSNYTVQGAGEQNGGTVTLLNGPLPTGQSLITKRVVEVLQQTDLRNQGSFYAEVHEDAFDRSIMIDQQQQEELDRTLKFDLLNRWNAFFRRIINVGAPVEAGDATRKDYVDAGDQGARDYADQINANSNSRALRTPEAVGQVPPVSGRSGRLLGFDSAGNPIAVVPSDQSASALALALANEVDQTKGAGQIGALGGTTLDRLNGNALRVNALYDGSDETATLQAVITRAISEGVRYVQIDGDLYAPGTLTDRGNVIFVGKGKLIGQYRREVYPHRVHPLGIGGIQPERHLVQFARARTPVVVIVGDSISTYSADSLARQATWASMVETKIRADNHGRTMTFHNRAIGSQTWTTFNSVPSPAPAASYAWYTNPARPWIDYLNDLSPDLVVVGFGMNDAGAFSRADFESAIAKMRAWTKVPDIVIVPNLVPALDPDPLFQSGFGSEAGQEGRDFAAGYVRTWAQRNNCGIIDLNRYENILRDGRDILSTHLERVASGVSATNGGYAGNGEKCRDWSFVGSITSGFSDWQNNPIGPLSMKLGQAAADVVFIKDSGSGNFRFEFYTSGGTLYKAVITTIPIPLTSFTMIAEKRGSTFLFRTVSDQTTSDICRVDDLLTHGGHYTPWFGYHSNNTGPFNQVFFNIGREELWLPQILDGELWGPKNPTAGTQQPSGGNGVNHPTSMGATAIYMPALMAANFRAQDPAAYYTKPTNAAATGYFGGGSLTGDNLGSTYIGNAATGATYFMAAGEGKVVLDGTSFRPVADGVGSSGSAVTHWERVWTNRLNVRNMGVYADNAAALAGGRLAGELYRTATGEVRVVY